MTDNQDDKKQFNKLKEEWGFGKEQVDVYGKIVKCPYPNMESFWMLVDVVSARDGTILRNINGSVITNVIVRPGMPQEKLSKMLGKSVLATLDLAPLECRKNSKVRFKLNADNCILVNELPDFDAMRKQRHDIEKLIVEKETIMQEKEALESDIQKYQQQLEKLCAAITKERLCECNIRQSVEQLKQRRALLGMKECDAKRTQNRSECKPYALRFIAEETYRNIRARGGIYRKTTIADLTACLATHDIVVLAGSSGSGKTSLCREFAQLTGSCFHLIPVKPNWTSTEDLLGYWSPIEKRFQKTPFLNVLLEANKDPNRLHLICLDEMNLARPEFYLADFLSLMEERKSSRVLQLVRPEAAIKEVSAFETLLRALLEVESEGMTEEEFFQLPKTISILRAHFGSESVDEVVEKFRDQMNWYNRLDALDREVVIPDNVRIVGTVNIDETTNFFSPKILDRVHVIRVENPLFDEEAIEDTKSYEEQEPLCVHASSFGCRTDYPQLDKENHVVDILLRLAKDVFNPIGMEISMRILRQSILYADKARNAGLADVEILTLILEHKLFPKCVFNADDVAFDGQMKLAYLGKLNKFPEIVGDTGGRIQKTVARLTAMGRNSDFINWWL